MLHHALQTSAQLKQLGHLLSKALQHDYMKLCNHGNVAATLRIGRDTCLRVKPEDLLQICHYPTTLGEYQPERKALSVDMASTGCGNNSSFSSPV